MPSATENEQEFEEEDDDVTANVSANNDQIMMNQKYPQQMPTSPMQMISDIEPVIDSTVSHMTEIAQLRDNQPIRTCCFSPSGQYFVLGTNSKALKICALPKLNGQGDAEEDNAVDSSGGLNNDAAEGQV